MHRVLIGCALIASTLFGAAELGPGSTAPIFEGIDQSGKLVRLSDFKGKSPVVLYFYPKDDTPGCTAQACSLRDGYSKITETSAVILGVSADDQQSHLVFASKYNLPFSILADPARRIIDAYGVGSPITGRARRWTFIIDKGSVIRQVMTEVKPDEHDRQVLEALEKLK